MMMALLPAFALPIALGFLVITALLRDDREASLIERLCLSYPLGLGLLTVQMFLLGLLRIPLTLLFTTSPLIIEIGCLLVWLRSQKVSLIPRRQPGLFEELSSSKIIAWKKTALLALLFWVIVKLVSVLVETSLRPLYAWDVWANWSAGAKMFYATHSLMLDSPAQDFFGRGVVSRILAYPLHNPLTQVWLALWAGSFDEVLVKFSAPLYLIALAGYLYRIIARETSSLISVTVLVMILSSPLLSYHAIELYSDLPLSIYLLFALAAVLQAMRGKQAYWILAGIFSAQALFTKDEALFLVAPLMLSACIFLWRNKTPSSRPYHQAAALLLPLLLVVPWFIFKFSHKLALGAEFIKLEFTFHPEIIKNMFNALMAGDNFNVLFLFIVVLLLLGGKPRSEMLHLLAPMICYAGFFVAIYSCTAYYYLEFTRGTVFYRNVLTSYPAWWLIAVMALKRILPEEWMNMQTVEKPLTKATKTRKTKR